MDDSRLPKPKRRPTDVHGIHEELPCLLVSLPLLQTLAGMRHALFYVPHLQQSLPDYCHSQVPNLDQW